MKNLFGILLLGLIVTSGFAQNPNWNVNASNYQFSMTFTTSLNINGTTLSSSNDKVAAFVNGEVRGVAGVTYVSRLNKYVSYLTVYANTNRETINFKIYDSTNDVVVDISKTIQFNIDGNVGSVFQTLSLANPVLNSSADITTFSFDGIQEKSLSISANTIDVLLPPDTDITNLVANFNASNNATVYIDRVLQSSGISVQDFTNPIVYQVLSEDESILKEYTVNVSVEVIVVATDVTLNLTSNSDNLVNINPVEILITASEEIAFLTYEDFLLTNAAIQSITKVNATTYMLNLVAVTDGDFSIEIPENTIVNLNNVGNIASNKLTFTYDSKQPYLLSILRKEPTTAITNADSLEFSVTFNEPVKNVFDTNFQTVSGATLVLQQISNTNYIVTVSNIENYNGTVSISLKNTVNITDLVGNVLRTSTFKNY